MDTQGAFARGAQKPEEEELSPDPQLDVSPRGSWFEKIREGTQGGFSLEGKECRCGPNPSLSQLLWGRAKRKQRQKSV